MTKIATIKTEIDTDPLSRGYSGMTDQQIADSLNTIDRNAPAPLDSIRAYMLLELRNDMTLFGRVEVVANSAVGSDPLNEVTLTLNHITTAKSMMAILQPASSFSLDTTDNRFSKLLSDLAAGTGCKAIAAADKTSIEAMSQNLQSRATEIGAGRVSTGHVTRARA